MKAEVEQLILEGTSRDLQHLCTGFAGCWHCRVIEALKTLLDLYS